MTKSIIRYSFRGSLLSATLFISGCGAFGGEGTLVPPSAAYQPAPLAQPAYPPLAYNSTGFDYKEPLAAAPIISAPPPPPPAPAPVQVKIPEPSYAPPPAPAMNNDGDMIPNSPILTPTNIIELSAVGMGVAPESTISPSQALALAKRAAIVDAYRQLGEKMYGIRVNAQDTVRDMVLQNSVIKTSVKALIRNAEVTETVYKDGLCQVSMQLKLDGRVWYKALTDI